MPDPRDQKVEGKRLREIREALGLSRIQLASKLGIGVATLKNAENGGQMIGARTLADAEDLLAPRVDGRAAPAVTSPPPAPNHAPLDATIKQVITMASDEAIVKAAKALSSALNVSEEEALAIVVRERIVRG
jgi:transcriptional regulator with XRE-family HTH domain